MTILNIYELKENEQKREGSRKKQGRFKIQGLFLIGNFDNSCLVLVTLFTIFFFFHSGENYVNLNIPL